jgi:hypothetical protein
LSKQAISIPAIPGFKSEGRNKGLCIERFAISTID